MASIEELQEELVRQSTKRLEAEHERSLLEDQWRAASKELNYLRKENASLRSENAALAQRAQAMEDDLAELSSSLLDQANQQVSDANKRAAATLKLVSERDALIESQEAQLQALKEMVNEVSEQSINKRTSESSRAVKGAFGTHGVSRSSPAPASPVLGANKSSQGTPQMGGSGAFGGNGNSVGNIAVASNSDQLSRDLILDLDSYSSPLRPLMRTDVREFKEFLEIWGVERSSHATRFGKLESPPWRRTRFVQRALQEDIEATLRLDRTPHMSWLSCRAFMSGILDKTMTLEPVSPKEMPWRLRPSHPCLLCGENRGAEKYARSYWAIPSPGAEPIVLDLACVAKAQLSCEFVAFLKHIASLPPSDTKTQIKAWRQCNTLKEQLFWARTGAMFPDLSDEIWDALNYSQYNQFDFDTVEEAEADIAAAQAALNAVPPSPNKNITENSASPSKLTRTMSSVSTVNKSRSESPSVANKTTKSMDSKLPGTTELSDTAQSNIAQSDIKKTTGSGPSNSDTAQSDTIKSNTTQPDTTHAEIGESDTFEFENVKVNTARSDTARSETAKSETAKSNTNGKTTAEPKTNLRVDYDEGGQADRSQSPTERFGTPSFAEQTKNSSDSAYAVPGAWPRS